MCNKASHDNFGQAGIIRDVISNVLLTWPTFQIIQTKIWLREVAYNTLIFQKPK